MDARWIGDYWGLGAVSPYDIFRGWTEDAHKLFPRYPEGLRVGTSSGALGDESWLPRQSKVSDLDGRGAVALLKIRPGAETRIVLHRRIDISDGHWVLEAAFSDLGLRRGQKYLAPEALLDLTAAAALIIAVDAERMLLRAGDRAKPPTISVRVGERADDNGRPCSCFVEPTVSLLQARRVRMEPLNWGGPAVAVSAVDLGEPRNA